jgi:hypothetical protein
MFLEDLSPMGYGSHRYREQAVAVGWLEAGHPFPQGPTPPGFRHKLGQLCQNPFVLYRGFHVCDFCDKDGACGNGEIHVAGADGVVFVAPALVEHYVVVHEYQPPAPFVEAVAALDVGPVGVGKLSQSIQRLADEPNPGNRAAFHEAFLKGRVGARVPREADAERFSIPVATLADGSPALYVLADVDILAEVEAGSTFLARDAKVVLASAGEKEAGIVVQNCLPGRKGLAIISKEDVIRLLKLSSREPRENRRQTAPGPHRP